MLSRKNAHLIYRLNQLAFVISMLFTIDGLIPREKNPTIIKRFDRPMEYKKHHGYVPSTTKRLIIMEHGEMLAGIQEMQGVSVGKSVLLYKTRVLGLPNRIWASDGSFTVNNFRVVHRYFFFLPWVVMLLSFYTIRINKHDVLLNIGITNVILILFHFYLIYH